MSVATALLCGGASAAAKTKQLEYHNKRSALNAGTGTSKEAGHVILRVVVDHADCVHPGLVCVLEEESI